MSPQSREIRKLLLQHLADPNPRDNQGRTPPHRALQGGSLTQSPLEIARHFVSWRANVNVTDDQGQTPLHAAARGGYWDIAELLLVSGARLDVQNWDQETPLLLVCGDGSLTFHSSL